MKLTQLFCLAPALLFTPCADAASIIDSIYGTGVGSFEKDAPDVPFYSTYAAGSTDISGWTVGMGSVDWVRNTVWTPSHGNYSIDMNGTVPPGDAPAVGSISTMFATTIGTTYRVNFDVSGYTGFGNAASPKQLEVSVKSVDLLLVASEISNTTHEFFPTNNSEILPLVLDWETRTVTFVATQATTSLTFTSKTTTNHSGILLDNVTVEAIPEPASPILVTAAAALLALRRNRRTGR